MSNLDNSVSGIPATEQRGSEQPADQIHREGVQYVKEASQATHRTGEDQAQGNDTRAATAAGPNSTASETSPLHARSTDEAPANFSGTQPLTTMSASSATTDPPPSTLGATEPKENAGRFVDAGSHLSSGQGPDFSANESSKSHSKGPSALGASTLSKSHADGTNADTEVRQQQPEDAEEKSQHKPPKPADASTAGKSSGGKMENPSAIPSAGGERLGEKHWGESQIVPDNPKPQTSEAGVSSKDGQPTSDVAANTAKNTGGASHGPGATEEKQSTVDKIKDKLHIGGKKE